MASRSNSTLDREGGAISRSNTVLDMASAEDSRSELGRVVSSSGKHERCKCEALQPISSTSAGMDRVASGNPDDEYHTSIYLESSGGLAVPRTGNRNLRERSGT